MIAALLGTSINRELMRRNHTTLFAYLKKYLSPFSGTEYQPITFEKCLRSHITKLHVIEKALIPKILYKLQTLV